jgi:hypothetical protein
VNYELTPSVFNKTLPNGVVFTGIRPIDRK